MISLRAEVRALVARHVAHQVAQELEQLCSEEPQIRIAPAPADRFVKLSAKGARIASDVSDWAAVCDLRTNLTWTRQVLDCGEVNHATAMEAAAAVRLFGATDWRAPTIEEQLSIIDYARAEPALDTTYFDGKHGWAWTSTPAKGLSGYAWGVALDDGSSGRLHQDGGGFVRAVRAGQQLDIGL
jgi:hypothetical protein